jgi:hypothetical protein
MTPVKRTISLSTDQHASLRMATAMPQELKALSAEMWRPGNGTTQTIHTGNMLQVSFLHHTGE